MEVKKMSWATVYIETKEMYILVDPLARSIEGQDRALAASLCGVLTRKRADSRCLWFKETE